MEVDDVLISSEMRLSARLKLASKISQLNAGINGSLIRPVD